MKYSQTGLPNLPRRCQVGGWPSVFTSIYHNIRNTTDQLAVSALRTIISCWMALYAGMLGRTTAGACSLAYTCMPIIDWSHLQYIYFHCSIPVQAPLIDCARTTRVPDDETREADPSSPVARQPARQHLETDLPPEAQHYG